MEIALHPDAAAEAREARLWYAKQSQEAAAKFLSELELAFAKIAERPMRWPVRVHIRKYVMRRFPFVILFRV